MTDFTSWMVGTQRRKVSWSWRATSLLFSFHHVVFRSQIVSVLFRSLSPEWCVINSYYGYDP